MSAFDVTGRFSPPRQFHARLLDESLIRMIITFTPARLIFRQADAPPHASRLGKQFHNAEVTVLLIYVVRPLGLLA